MNRILTLTIALFTISCTISSVTSSSLTGSDRVRMIRIAKQEVERRNARLPQKYEVVVEETQAGHELERQRPVYQVSFSFVYQGKKQVIYTVIIDKRTRKVEVFSDSRESIPSKV